MTKTSTGVAKSAPKKTTPKPPVNPTPTDLLVLAVQQDLDIEKLERLMEMNRKWQIEENRKQFFSALSQFQSQCPVIDKNREVSVTGNRGSFKYKYATLDGIASQIQPVLEKCGLTYRWEYSEQENIIGVTCIITHLSGHSEKTTTTAKADVSGSKNEIQSRGSTLTYLQRYTLIGALGITTAQDDVDGKQKGDGKNLHSDIIKSIEVCNTVDELEMCWEMNEELHTDKQFIQLIKEKKMKLVKGGGNGGK